MTDEELLKAGERLYNSFVQSPFSFLELAGLAAARERKMPWSQLGPRLKFAVLRLVVGPEPEGSATTSSDAPPGSASPASLAATAPSSPATNLAPATAAGQDPTPSSTVEAPLAAHADGAPMAPASAADTTEPAVLPDPADSGEEGGDNGDDHV